MEHKKDRYFGLSQSDGEVEKQEPGFHKGMLLKKKVPSAEDDTFIDTSGSKDGGYGGITED